MTTPTPHGATVQIIEPPEFAPRPSITESMSKDALWSYACLVGYRYKLSEHDREQSAQAAIQQAAGAVPEGWQDLIDELETAAGRITQYSNSPLDGLLQAAADALRTASPVPPKQQPDHLAGGECGGVKVPLTDERIEELADASDRWANAMSDCGELEKGRQTWQAARDTEFARNIEADHGITARAPRPEAPTGQINPDSHAPLQGKEANHG